MNQATRVAVVPAITILILSGCLVQAQQQRRTVTVEDVSVFYGKSISMVESVTVGWDGGTYVLSCADTTDKDTCVAPIVGKTYAMVEEPVHDTSPPTIHLIGPNVAHGLYELEVYVPFGAANEIESSLRDCVARDRMGGDQIRCATWLRRVAAVRKMACPDPYAQSACNSFQELIAAHDTDFMGDFESQDHIYVCFPSHGDEFFEATFSEPGFSWNKPGEEDGLPKDSLFTIGGAQLAYYKNGVGDAEHSYGTTGKWVYLPLGRPTDPGSLIKFANSSTSSFRADSYTSKTASITIEDNRFVFSDTYKNASGTTTTHSIVLELPTGRFTEKYELTDTGGRIKEVSGRCLIVPQDKF